MRKKGIWIMALVLVVVTVFAAFVGEPVADQMRIPSKEQVERVELYPYIPTCGVGFYTYTVTNNELGQALVKLAFDTPVRLEPSTYNYYDLSETREIVKMVMRLKDLPKDYPYYPHLSFSFLDDGTVIVEMTSLEDYQSIQYQFKTPLFSPLTYETVKAALQKKR